MMVFLLPPLFSSIYGCFYKKEILFFIPRICIYGALASILGCGYHWANLENQNIKLDPTYLLKSDIYVQHQTSHLNLRHQVYRLLQPHWSHHHLIHCPLPLYFKLKQSVPLPLGQDEMTSSFHKISLTYIQKTTSSMRSSAPRSYTFSSSHLHHQAHPAFFPHSPSEVINKVLPSLIDQFLFFCSSVKK